MIYGTTPDAPPRRPRPMFDFVGGAVGAPVPGGMSPMRPAMPMHGAPKMRPAVMPPRGSMAGGMPGGGAMMPGLLQMLMRRRMGAGMFPRMGGGAMPPQMQMRRPMPMGGGQTPNFFAGML